MPEEILDYLGGRLRDYRRRGTGSLRPHRGLNEGRSVPAITRNGAAFHSGDAMTCQPLWDPALINFYTGQSGMISMQTKRGCPHKCAYCTYPAIEGDKVRQRPA